MTVQLPDEIVDQILYLACTLPALSSNAQREPPSLVASRLKARSSAPHLDIPTTLKLLRLSPHHYPYITSILYKGPRLSDPISLSLFARTLTNRPALGRLVRHLWVGHTYQGEAIPGPQNAGQAGTQNSYALTQKLATFSDLRQSLARGLVPSNLLSPDFEKQIAQWAAQNVQANSRTIDPLRAPRGIHPDSPGSGDPDSRGWHWIGVDEWVLRLWDGRDLVIQFRELAQISFFLELQRLLKQAGASLPVEPPSRKSAPASLLETDLVSPFQPRSAADRISGTEADPMDWADADHVAPNPSLDDSPIYSDDLDLDVLDGERDIYFAEMGVNTKRHKWSELAKVGDQMVEWWLIWSVARTRARARLAARRIFEVEQRNKRLHHWKPLRPQPELNAKNHFTHPTLFARSGASHLLVGGALPPARDEGWNGARPGVLDYETDSDTGSDSEPEDVSEGSDYESDNERPARPSRSRPDRPSAANVKLGFTLPEFVEQEQQKSEDQADLWGGEHNFASGNERAGAGNTVLGSRGGMFGYDSALRRGLFNETAPALDDGTEYATMQNEMQRKRNQEDRLLSEMTLGSILSSLRTVVMLAPRLQNMAMDGVLERSICGRRPMCSMGKLKSLSLGPPPPYWCSPLLFGHPMKTTRRQRISFHQETRSATSPGTMVDESRSQSMWPLPGVLIPSPAFATLRTLHISGCMLFPSEAKAVGGLGGQLPSLRHFRWSLWQPHVEGHPVGVVETLCAIMDMPTTEEEAGASSQSSSTAQLAQSFSTSASSGTYRELENGKRRRKHDTLRRSNPLAAVGASITEISSGAATPSATELHEASLYALVTRKRKLRSVYATVHPTDEAIFARKAPHALRFDPRLKIDTAKCQATEDNLEEMQRWWEWESGMLNFKPTVSNLEAINAAARRKLAEGPPTSISAQELNADHSGIEFDLERAMGTELELEPRPSAS